jgi:hypothetical protein
MPSAGRPGGAATAASRGDGTLHPWWGGDPLLLWLGDGAVGAVVGALGVAMARGSAFGLLAGGRTVVPLAVACVIVLRRRLPLPAASAALLGWVLVGTLCAVPELHQGPPLVRGASGGPHVDEPSVGGGVVPDVEP